MTRWTRFAGVGVMGFVVQLVTLQLLNSLVRVHPIVAVALSVEAAILHNFIWHERWTWPDRVSHSRRGRVIDRLVRFNAAAGTVALVGNVTFTTVFASVFHLPLLIANVMAVGSLTALNYFLADRLAYRPSAPAVDAIPSGRRLTVRRSFFVWLALAVTSASGRPMHAAELTPPTIAAWNRYVATVEARRARESGDPDRFLAIDFDSGAARSDAITRLRRGDTIVQNVPGGTIDVDGGTISHWRGHIFIPGVSVTDVVENAALRGRAGAHRQQDVIESRVLSRDADSLRLFLKLQRRAVVTVAYNTEHVVSYQRVGADRAASRSLSTRIAELREPGTPDEAEKRVGQDRGFLWRLHSYWRYQAAPGGVIVELESLTLSRDIPWSIRAIAGPIIDGIARESMSRTLTSLRGRFAGSTAD